MAKYAHYRTDVPGRIPDAADLAVGEIAINTADKILYTKTPSGQVVRCGAGSYTKSEMDQKFLPQGILPVTRVGDLSDSALPITQTGGELQVSVDIPVLISGRQFKITTGTYNFSSTIAGNSGAAVLNVYVTLVNAVATFEYSLVSLPESFVRVYIGKMDVTDQTASNLLVNKVSRLDVYRPSPVAVGSAFPVSSSTPDKLSQTTW